MKKLYIPYLIFWALFNSTALFAIEPPQEYCIVVHGTYAHEFNWYQPGGHFFEGIKEGGQNWSARIIPFGWSGGNNNVAREQAARQLALWISVLPVNARIHCVAHSHGANVCIRASQILNEQNSPHKLHSLVTLGAPINMKRYAPEYEKIDKLYNFFSFNDYVQPVYGYLPDREYPAHKQCANIRTFLNCTQPTHCQLHCKAIGRWIAWMLHNPDGYPNLFDSADRYVRFSDENKPSFMQDTLRPILALHDRKYNHSGPRIAAQVIYENFLIDTLCGLKKKCIITYQSGLEYIKKCIAYQHASLLRLFKRK